MTTKGVLNNIYRVEDYTVVINNKQDLMVAFRDDTNTISDCGF
jgi:hypothetical protein